MACHYLNLKNADEFYMKLKNREVDLVLKMTKCVLSAFKRGKDKIDIFDITLDRRDMLITLKQNLQIHELHEDYEGCARISSAIKSFESNQK